MILFLYYTTYSTRNNLLNDTQKLEYLTLKTKVYHHYSLNKNSITICWFYNLLYETAYLNNNLFKQTKLFEIGKTFIIWNIFSYIDLKHFIIIKV